MNSYNELLKLETVEIMVAEWDVIFPGRSVRSLEELAMIKTVYYRDLAGEGVTEQQFKWAAVQAGKRTDFFPTRRLIFDCVKEYRTSPPRKYAAIPETTSRHDPLPGEEETAAEILKLVRLATAGKIPYVEAAERMENLAASFRRNSKLGNWPQESPG